MAAIMMAVVTATIGIVTAMVTAMTAMVTVTTMTTVTMTGERGHGKQHGSRYRANKRELPKHEFLHRQPAILYPWRQRYWRCACSANNDDLEASTFPCSLCQ
jgi:hypothetical protein